MRARRPAAHRYMEVRTRELGHRGVEDAISSLRDSPGKAPNQFDRIARTAAHALGVPNACIYLIDPYREEDAYFGPGSNLLAPFLRELAAEGGSRDTVIVNGGEETTPSGDGAASASYVAVPIGTKTGLGGFFCVFDFTPRCFSDHEIGVVHDFADLAAGEVDRHVELEVVSNNEERFRAVTESAQDVVAILDRDAKFTYVSPSASSIFGAAPAELIGTSIYSCVYAEDLEAFHDALADRISDHARWAHPSVLSNGDTESSPDEDVLDIEFRKAYADGLRHLRLIGKNLFDRRGVEGFLIHVRDVTDRAAFDAEILKSRDRAEEMSRLKSVFLTNMSHEIRTPLTTILGFAEILVDEVDEDALEFVRLIQQGGERLLDTLMSILDLARLESSSFDISAEPFDVAEKIGELCRLMTPLAGEKGLYLDFEQRGASIEAVLDMSAVERVVSNLLSNGIKFTKDGGVTVSLEADDEHVLIHVADTGIGISEEFMPYLFEDFKQESEGLSRMHEGSGLGLSITKRLVQLMKGNIMAESEKGRGTVFTVALPRNGESAVLDSSKGNSDDDKRTRVLVVEDNADTRTLVNHLLRKNYEVRCATDADEALQLASEERYDVLLVDINLGKGKSGEDVLHAVKSLPNYEEIPVIAVTAYAMPGDRERFFAEGFDDYVSKPFSKQRLLEALEGVLV